MYYNNVQRFGPTLYVLIQCSAFWTNIICTMLMFSALDPHYMYYNNVQRFGPTLYVL